MMSSPGKISWPLPLSKSLHQVMTFSIFREKGEATFLSPSTKPCSLFISNNKLWNFSNCRAHIQPIRPDVSSYVLSILSVLIRPHPSFQSVYGQCYCKFPEYHTMTIRLTTGGKKRQALAMTDWRSGGNCHPKGCSKKKLITGTQYTRTAQTCDTRVECPPLPSPRSYSQYPMKNQHLRNNEQGVKPKCGGNDKQTQDAIGADDSNRAI